MFDEPTETTRDAARILSRNILVPGTFTDAQPYGGVNGAYHVQGDIKGFPGQRGAVVVAPQGDGTVYIAVSAVIPARWKFTTTLVDYMLTETMVECFEEHITPRLLGAVQEFRDAR